jgi:hypothetical protein
MLKNPNLHWWYEKESLQFIEILIPEDKPVSGDIMAAIVKRLTGEIEGVRKSALQSFIAVMNVIKKRSLSLQTARKCRLKEMISGDTKIRESLSQFNNPSK